MALTLPMPRTAAVRIGTLALVAAALVAIPARPPLRP